MKRLEIILFLLLVMLLVSCGSDSKNKGYGDELYALENNNHTFITNFDYNEGTAYRWYYEIDTDGALIVESEEYVPLKQNQAIGGGPGKYNISFRVADNLVSNLVITIVFTYNTFNTSEKHPKTYEFDLRLVKTGEIEVLDFKSKNLNGPDEAEHKWVHYNHLKASCGVDGHSAYTECSICGEKRNYECYPAPALEHDFELISTSTLPVYEEYICKNCGLRKLIYENEEEMNNLSILFVGNSYTNYNTMVNAFKGIVEGEGLSVYVKNVSVGGAYLLDYVSDPEGQYYRRVSDAVTAKKYDFVFLQEYSLNPANNPANFYTNVRKLYNYFVERNTTCLLYETWTRNFDNANDEYIMAQKLCASYTAIGEELGIKVSHCGTAVYNLMVNHPEIVTHQPDNSHPSTITSYVVALCHFATLYGRSPIKINYTYNDYIKDSTITWHSTNERVEISDEMQRLLEQIAYDAVFGKSMLADKYITTSVGIGE